MWKILTGKRLKRNDLAKGEKKDEAHTATEQGPPQVASIEPSILPHSSFTSLELRSEMTTLGADFPPPPDLTSYIAKADDQYVAGGGFGDVYRCWYHDGSLKEVAVKAFRFRFAIDGDASDTSVKMLRRELGIWRRLDHLNVVPFLGIAYGFGMRGAMSLVSLWMRNESLHHFLAKHDDNLGLGHRLQFLLDIANGLHYLHSLPIVHGDLNSNNVLLDVNYTARLADFGYASLVGNIPEALTYLQRSTARPGALRWIAPEQVDPEETFIRTTKSDIYSFGCVALQVFSGKQPWSEVREDSAVVLRLAKGHKPGRPEFRAMGDSYWNLVQDCWSPMEMRPSAEVIIYIIQEFLNDIPQSPPLCDSLMSTFFLVDASSPSSLSQGTVVDSMRILGKQQDVAREENESKRATRRLIAPPPSAVEDGAAGPVARRRMGEMSRWWRGQWVREGRESRPEEVVQLDRPGLIPASFVELRDPGSNLPIDDVEALMDRGDLPKVKDWKKATNSYQQNSISLGVIDDTQSSVPNSPYTQTSAP
ncbi:kinase-like protein, partial [Imleria badia]